MMADAMLIDGFAMPLRLTVAFNTPSYDVSSATLRQLQFHSCHATHAVAAICR